MQFFQYLLRVHEADETHLPISAKRQHSKESETSDEDSETTPKPEKVEQNLKDPKCQVDFSRRSWLYYLFIMTWQQRDKIGLFEKPGRQILSQR